MRYNDVILTLFHTSLRLDREIYERLVRALYEFYDTQERSSGQYKFSSGEGSSCVIGTSQTRVTEYFRDDGPELVADRMQQVVSAVSDVLGFAQFKAYDVQISALVLQKDLGNLGKINYLSSEEYITNTFLQELDYGPLGGVTTGVGLRFLYRQEDDAYDLRIEPYFKDKKYLFLDLAAQYNRSIERVDEVRDLIDTSLAYMRTDVLSFVRHEKKSD